jgi:hypothetical protein
MLLSKLRLYIGLPLHEGSAFHVLLCCYRYLHVKASGKLQLTGFFVILWLGVADWAVGAIFAIKGGILVDIKRQSVRK